MRLFAIVLALATMSSTSVFAADVDVAMQFHLFGEWAADCSSAPSPSNPHETYGLDGDGDGTVTRTLTMNVSGLDGKSVLHKLKAVAPDLLQSEWVRLADDKVTTVIERIEGDVSHSWSSIDSGGTVYVAEGHYVPSQEPTIVFHRCGTK